MKTTRTQGFALSVGFAFFAYETFQDPRGGLRCPWTNCTQLIGPVGYGPTIGLSRYHRYHARGFIRERQLGWQGRERTLDIEAGKWREVRHTRLI